LYYNRIFAIILCQKRDKRGSKKYKLCDASRTVRRMDGRMAAGAGKHAWPFDAS
jgi:hypothetical protein